MYPHAAGREIPDPCEITIGKDSSYVETSLFALRTVFAGADYFHIVLFSGKRRLYPAVRGGAYYGPGQPESDAGG